jgi:hypothetical protein
MGASDVVRRSDAQARGRRALVRRGLQPVVPMELSDVGDQRGTYPISRDHHVRRGRVGRGLDGPPRDRDPRRRGAKPQDPELPVPLIDVSPPEAVNVTWDGWFRPQACVRRGPAEPQFVHRCSGRAGATASGVTGPRASTTRGDRICPRGAVRHRDPRLGSAPRERRVPTTRTIRMRVLIRTARTSATTTIERSGTAVPDDRSATRLSEYRCRLPGLRERPHCRQPRPPLSLRGPQDGMPG